jgi:histidinol-phosphate/aromatic aminotransferase/cobyric acid decarboxylase-like protein
MPVGEAGAGAVKLSGNESGFPPLRGVAEAARAAAAEFTASSCAAVRRRGVRVTVSVEPDNDRFIRAAGRLAKWEER